MAPSNDLSSDGARAPLDESQVLRRMQRLAVVLGVAAILAAALIGWSAHAVSRRVIVDGISKKLLEHATRYAKRLGDSPSMSSVQRGELEAIEQEFAADKQVDDLEDASLLVLDENLEIVLDTADRAREGSALPGSSADDDPDEPGPDLRALVDDSTPWRGAYGWPDGSASVAGFAPLAGKRGLVSVHIPSDAVEARVLGQTLPWTVGFAFTVLLAVPLALWGLSKAYTDTARAEMRARAAERRSAEQVRILREIDRAILAGGSVEEISRAALARIRVLIPCLRASVARIDAGLESCRLVAVDSAAPTLLGESTIVPFAQIGPGVLETLRAGKVHWASDADPAFPSAGFFETLRKEGVRSFLKVPLIGRGELVGTLNLSFAHPGRPAAEDVELAREVADVLALAVVQASMHSELQVQAAELEQRVAARTRELSEVNAELEGYVHSVSHDLRAPLRAVRGFGNLLIEEVGTRLGPTEREYLQRMVSASERMDALMRDLLAYSRLSREDVKVRALDTQHVVDEAESLLQIDLEEKEAVIDLEKPLLPVLGHHSTLVQAVANLVSNAVKFVGEGVRPHVRIRTERRGDLVRLWVEDNGIGIPADGQAKIFRVFERLNGVRAYPGTGMGLAIVRRAVERMGGTVGVESSVGEGSRFWIELAAAEGQG